MTYIRSGECNMCGECCGYPRSTDGEQINPWTPSLPEDTISWSDESLKESIPLFKIVRHPKETGKRHGSTRISEKDKRWIWVKKEGLCVDKFPYGDESTYDKRCPFLSKKLADGTTPCLLYNTKHKYIWDKLCQPVPPLELITKEQVDKWFTNCPSCSYKYEEK